MPTLHVTVTEEHHRRAEEARYAPVRPAPGRCESCDISQAMHDLGYPKALTSGLEVWPYGDHNLQLQDILALLPAEGRLLAAKSDRNQPIAFPVEFDLEWSEPDESA